MRKIAVSLTKGGVGKSTTAVNLSAGMAAAGVRVLLVDADTQGHAAFMLGTASGGGLAEVISAGSDIRGAIVKARDNLWLVSGGKSLSAVSRHALDRDRSGERILSDALQTIEGGYDCVILDTPPGWDAMAVNVHFYAQEVLAPVSLDVLTLKGLSDFEHRLKALAAYKAVRMRYILPTFLDGRVRKSREVYEILKSHYGERVCPPIRYNVRLSEAAGHGQTIFEYAPRSTGAEDYRMIAERIIKDGNA